MADMNAWVERQERRAVVAALEELRAEIEMDFASVVADGIVHVIDQHIEKHRD